MTEKLKQLINNLKHLPGVYLMHDKDGKIIYVGKAKDLQKRVSQYFLRPQSGKVFKMVQSVDYFETIITSNEKEALVLEMNLIQEHYPRFNILLKDDKHYPYIALRKGKDPFLTIKRNDFDKKFDYFGPFPNSGAAYETINLLNKIFPLRKCNKIPSSPCLYYHIGNCLAPCIKEVPESLLSDLSSKIKDFLKGDNLEVQQNIKEKMIEASENEDFETALEYKKILTAIKHINDSQNVEIKDKKDRDIFAFTSREAYISLAVLIYRSGILLGKKTFVVDAFGDLEEQISDLILQFYQKSPLPKEIIINSSKVIENIEPFLSCNISEAKTGKFYELVLNCSTNANNALDEYFMSARLDDDKLEMLTEIGNTLGINTPFHIELFDNSHLQGSSSVGAMVAFINGEPAKKLYRKFHIEHEEKRDDLLSMKEVISRHYSRLIKEERKLPDLILVDGGLRQIQTADKTIKDLNLNIPVFGLFKNDKHQTKGLMGVDEKIYDFQNNNIFFMLARMQDEVHRFAISFHKSLRKKAMTSSIFDGIKGLGKRRREILEKSFPDINTLKEATIEELEQYIPSEVARALKNKLNN